MTKMLGIDWGEKRIGLAIADDSLAQPYGLVGEFAELEKVIEKEGVEKVVLGLPEGKHEKQVRALARKIEALGIPVVFRSEILTSREALQKAIEAGKSKKSRRQLDALSAALLLQEHLDNPK
ncbi:hypothetical protein A2797_01620 [candidate division WWE3 bacterium RIFCSPHIGHO2_01_FULL_48_15]|uniref:Putative pre-16S rRNA nuclease n=1 Tax=candidate division WWE3 bacterium RIFCSPHIGHO2_01_FULL_48_15 TaxID=1802619 RepID=A0A1F4VD51_UNCKA|nr:MAG: hypothetical protein A2797_01620 [candidate division WWE3 bacterium RIFCSPHIGHO2_01_FULL_48_15]